MRYQHGVGGPRIRTMGQAEEIGYRLLALGAGMLGVGLLLLVTVVLSYLGIPLAAAGALLILADICWLFAINRRMTEEVRCPECHKRNVALHGVSSFRCDDCGHEIVLKSAVTNVTPDGRVAA